jgi:hypothetical protein
MSVTIGVSMVPGQIALIRIPRGAYSKAALRVRPMTPCLAAWYAARPGQPDESAEGRAVDDGATAVVAHLMQLMLHAGPYAAKVDRVHPVEDFRRLISGVARWGLDAGVVERHVQPAEGVNRCLQHRRNAGLVGHVTSDGQHLVSCLREVVRGGAESFLVDIGEDDSCARLGEGMHRGEAHARAPTRDERDLAGEVIRRVHGCLLRWMDVVLPGVGQSERGLIRR